jgi:hypothetical protein
LARRAADAALALLDRGSQRANFEDQLTMARDGTGLGLLWGGRCLRLIDGKHFGTLVAHRIGDR